MTLLLLALLQKPGKIFAAVSVRSSPWLPWLPFLSAAALASVLLSLSFSASPSTVPVLTAFKADCRHWSGALSLGRRLSVTAALELEQAGADVESAATSDMWQSDASETDFLMPRFFFGAALIRRSLTSSKAASNSLSASRLLLGRSGVASLSSSGVFCSVSSFGLSILSGSSSSPFSIAARRVSSSVQLRSKDTNSLASDSSWRRRFAFCSRRSSALSQAFWHRERISYSFTPSACALDMLLSSSALRASSRHLISRK